MPVLRRRECERDCCCKICVVGKRGHRGRTGPTGNTGPTGSVGKTGSTGNTGSIGNTGNIGPTGPVGNSTLTGITGSTGQVGGTGVTGPVGQVGNTGDIGPTGPVGNTGITGSTGQIGDTGVTGPVGQVGNTGDIGPTGPVGNTGPVGSTGDIGNTGPLGITGVTGPVGQIGSTGPVGNTGSVGPTGPTEIVGYAEYIHITQTPNNSVPPGVAFTIDTEVFNSMPTQLVASAGAGGTVFTLAPGIYVIDYETSLASAGSIGIYTGALPTSLSLDTSTVSGSSTATTWIHGRGIELVLTSLVFAISPVVGTADVTTAGTDSSSYMIRITILKIV